jgi:hypothetical protein
MWGQASLTVKIEILFFSTSVSVKMEREFAGSDPTFHQLVAPASKTGQLVLRRVCGLNCRVIYAAQQGGGLSCRKQTLIWTALPNGSQGPCKPARS